MSRNDRTTALAGALVLAIGMGFGRFAFTGLYPLMVAEQQISVEAGSYAASANYAGYLIGALLLSLWPTRSSRAMCALAVLTTAALLGLLGLPLSPLHIILVRGLAGVSSAVAMVAAAQWLLHDRGLSHEVATLFAGVGIGILLSAEIIAAGHAAALPSRSLWLLLGGVSLVLGSVALWLQSRAERDERPPTSDATAIGGLLGPYRLTIVYGLAGFGYIITATYLPLLVRNALSSVDPAHIWALFGLGAMPSCFLWHALHRRWGSNVSLAANLGVQAVGVVLPVLHHPVAYVASALIVGGTFVGTVTIALPAARKVAALVRFDMIAVMTLAYGAGQIAGPFVANALYLSSGSFDASLLVAGLVLLTAAALSLPKMEPRRVDLTETTAREAAMRATSSPA